MNLLQTRGLDVACADGAFIAAEIAAYERGQKLTHVVDPARRH
jgi:hypothetical protein